MSPIERTLRRIAVACAFTAAVAWASNNADLYNPHLAARPGLTTVGDFDLADRQWFGPLVLENRSDEELVVTSVQSGSESLEIVSSPEKIPPGEKGIFEAVFTPSRTGFFAVTAVVETNLGPRPLRLRARVEASSRESVLGLQWPANRSVAMLDPSVFVDDETVAEAMRDGDIPWSIRLVDPRPPEAFARGHVQHAENLSLFELEHSPTAREMPVFVIDNGMLDSTVYSQLLRLRQQGFPKLRWVRGGLNGLEAAGVLVQHGGDATGSHRRVMPLALFNSHRLHEFVVVNATSLPSSTAFEPLFPSNTVVDFHFGKELETADELVALLTGSAKAPLSTEAKTAMGESLRKSFVERLKKRYAARQPFLVIGENDAAAINVVSLLVANGFPLAWHLDGSRSDLVQFLEARIAATTPQTRRYQVRAGARNPLGKAIPKPASESDCPGCD